MKHESIHPRALRRRKSTETQLNEMSDASLIVAVARYNQDALAEIFRRHGGAVHALAKRVTRDTALAEEVTQELFVRLWNEPERYDSARGTLRTFLLMQAHRRSVDVIRSEEARKRREQNESASIAATSYDIDHEFGDLADREAIRGALEILPQDERRAIELAFYHGLTYREVAQRLEQPEGTVKTRIRTGLKRMNEALVSWKAVET
ncbi:sigma-70 family RNA polymerase sigma factor [Ferrimicrobium acidiphilum]|jgi:RNA polymerase sigma-70 factor (ECF subfamily)|uniref:ECF RNA polymerase sigma factor SigK n=1 Tax=Ferrimicrobium acidiphilum DSM 19497 TaxID=1121877 RepID=A0A0D8FYM4_9ACTN|nr:sigma-70 family RNA polymerase sigma factor [Ferrimicrobium acidiphilum]KJE77537.1 ECF RNA polymerase sigma factor SigK [Ferrimicrobium acidiphilum DSM 19497]